MTYQLVLQLPVSKTTDFDLLLDLESRLIIGLRDNHNVDGHDFGSGEMNIFIHTGNPNQAFSEIRQLIDFDEFPNSQVAYRNLEENGYTRLWPENCSESFSVT